MKKILLVLSLLGLPALALAQERPIAASTLQTTDTSTGSVKVGCAIGSSTCTGGIMSGPIAATLMSLSSGYVELQSFVPGATTNRLYNNGGTLTWAGSAVAIGGAVGPGTTGKLTKFTGANSVGDSICSESGTTITCVNTVSATTLTGTLSTASQTAITGVGTITTGTWNATKVGLLYGGTNADLSGTGGTSQFLRQNTLGGAVTVVRPAVSDLSDGTNVALLNTGNDFSQSATGANTQQISNSHAAGTTELSSLQMNVDTGGISSTLNLYSASFTTSGSAAAGAARWNAGGVGGINIVAVNGSGAIRFYTGGDNLRWGINAAGDKTGPSGNIIFAVGTPSVTSGGGSGATISGSPNYDSAFAVALGTTNSTSISILFGHPFTNAPYCNAVQNNANGGAMTNFTFAPVTTSITIAYAAASSANTTLFVTCTGR